MSNSFDDFWPYYVRAHSRARTRTLHAAGSVLAVVMLGVAFAVNLWFLIAVPLVGYAFAWYAHFFVEHNKPATFGHPFYSLFADYRMVFLMMAGKMDEEVARCLKMRTEPGGVATPAAPEAAVVAIPRRGENEPSAPTAADRR